MHSSTQVALPVLQNERSDILDILRGFALFGVLLDIFLVLPVGAFLLCLCERPFLPGLWMELSG
jgi:hypothetical protein